MEKPTVVHISRKSLFLWGFIQGSCVGVSLDKTRRALSFARTKHEGQIRKDGRDFYEHPTEVLMLLLDLKIDDDELLASSILHDLVEDERCRIDEIEERFGKDVAHLVRLQTKEPGETVKAYFARVASDVRSIIGKAADRFSNLTDAIAAYELDRLIRYVDETVEYVLPMIKRARLEHFEFNRELTVLCIMIEAVIAQQGEYIRAKQELVSLKPE